MGFGTFWNMQFHQSWVLFLPLSGLAFYWRRKEEKKESAREVCSFGLGGCLPLVFLVPTFWQFGLHHTPSGITQSFRWFNWDNMKMVGVILARYLSLAAYEMPRFVGGGTGERLAFMNQVPWLYPPGIFLLVIGWIQPLVLLGSGFWKGIKNSKPAFWAYGLTMGIFLMIWGCFWFTTTGPSAHMYFLFMPWVVVYSFFVWERLKGNVWKKLAWACLIASVWFQAGFMIQNAKGHSFWASRAAVAQAIEKQDYRLLSERRDGSYY
jgi:hypothetical protein